MILRADTEGTSEIAFGERGVERLLVKGHVLVRVEGEPGLAYVQVPFVDKRFIEEVVSAARSRDEHPAD